MAKVMISIPDQLLKRVDARAEETGASRSGLLQAAAERELERPTPAQVRDVLREGRRQLEGGERIDWTEWIRRDRDSR